ncbi:MAG: beta-ketoacyl synthase N-terminal-like domain-containing protein [Anaerolineae bacterium]|jgi:polyketide-type polyunsaturated fatty acid synthase PfaA|nr:beta-ketoacyl synthase N-terminal-like domain-containing protein [Anaerolineae bacterium]
MATPRNSGRKPFANLQDHPVAIIGIDAIFPDAPDLQSYWNNIYQEVDSIIDIPANRWNIDDYFDPDPKTPDHSYSKRGGFIPDIPFNPMEYGLPPTILDVTDVTQLLALVVAKRALMDAGYFDGAPEILERTGVTLGMVGMGSKVATALSARMHFPIWRRALRNVGITNQEAEHVIEKIQAAYIDWNENAFPGALGNIVAGRITNRFDLGATNCTLDAACASSLAAIHLAVSDLITGRADMMLTGGVDLDNSILTYLCFSKTPALTAGEKVCTFDESASGMLPGEGAGMIVLKRLADAERDGDRIYAVIRGVGTSSDGRYKSIYAPRPEGQAKALRRAYDEAGFAPQTVGLVEAHGTGTPAGDPAEVEALKMVFTPQNGEAPSVALGSVKSQIGHTKAAAGIAGMIKTIMALHHKVLPATLNVDTPSAKLGLDESLFYVNSENRPWFRKEEKTPRRAGVSAFGFGGTNFHIVLEEHLPTHEEPYRMIPCTKMVLLHEINAIKLKQVVENLLSSVDESTAEQALIHFAKQTETEAVPAEHARIGFVADNGEDFIKQLHLCLEFLSQDQGVESWDHPKGIYYRKTAMDTQGKVVALFPGQGSQTVNMGSELAMMYPPVLKLLEEMNRLRTENGLDLLTNVLYPMPVFTEADRKTQQKTLTQTENAQPAIGALSAAMYDLLSAAGFEANFTAGHSFGEITALWAAGVISKADFLQLTIDRGEAMKADPEHEAGTMLAVKGNADAIIAMAATLEDVSVANINTHQQVVLAGTVKGIGMAQTKLADAGFGTIPLSVSSAFHSELVAHAQQPFAEAIRKKKFNKPSLSVYSNNTTKPHSDDPSEIQSTLENHILASVNFRKEIENIYADGGRVFVEIGPRNTLTRMVENILEGKEFYTVALNSNHRADADQQFRQAYLQLKVLGLPLSVFDHWMLWSEAEQAKEKPKMQVTLNGGIYHSEAMKKKYQQVMNDGYQIERNQVTMVPQEQNQTQPAQASSQPPATQPTLPLNGRTAAIHEQYLQAAQEFNRAMAALAQVEQDLVRLGNQNGTHQHLEAVVDRITRLMAHQETMLNLHTSVLMHAPAPDTNTSPVIQPINEPVTALAPQPQMTAAAPVKAVSVQTVAVPSEPELAQIAPPSPVVKQTPAVEPAPVPAVLQNSSGIDQLLLRVVSEKTGYPEETLELGMSMEADLGIDSIKRVEILGAMQDELPDIDEIDMEELNSLTTLQDVVLFMEKQVSAVPGKKA